MFHKTLRYRLPGVGKKNQLDSGSNYAYSNDEQYVTDWPFTDDYAKNGGPGEVWLLCS